MKPQAPAPLATPVPALGRHPWHDFLHRLEKPARYTGGEYQSIRKDWAAIDVRYALCFPDVYDIGMSHLGTKILYKIVNDLPWALGERCFAPWVDAADALRARGLPLISLESHQPLASFDVIGFSLQYELTYTNVLEMLHLGGVPLRNSDRGEGDPLVIAGGPSATHPEPMTPFIDAFVVGDGEETLPRMLATLRTAKAEGWGRRRLLVAWAGLGGVYCPDLYERTVRDEGGFEVVVGALDEAPLPVVRQIVDDIDRYPFPDDAPVAAAEAIFDRMSIEIARGCTEGCRFCQAGMIYRPVRERSPTEVVRTVLSAIDKAGYDEVSLTTLSTADYSCISPLVKEVARELRARKASLSVASLRAYGLAEDLLDDIGSIRASSLTFAPEAGSQRMRDVINKNIDEQDLHTTAHRVFSRQWKKVKCYFIIGLPTEEDEDVFAIIDMARDMRDIGRLYKRDAVVTVSVSSHVPKPHTPFQWAAMDTLDEIERKQRVLFDGTRREGLPFRRHDARGSVLEGVLGRGDRRVGAAIEAAWRAGARFDGWDEHLDFERWQRAFADTGVEPDHYLGRLREDVALPWDHLDVGLAPGFLLREWKRALKDRLSPPCGKPVGMQVHHTHVEAPLADTRKLVCYHCGVACDMERMRSDRVTALRTLAAEVAARQAAEAAAEQAAAELAVAERAATAAAETARPRDAAAADPADDVAAAQRATDAVHLVALAEEGDGDDPGSDEDTGSAAGAHGGEDAEVAALDPAAAARKARNFARSNPRPRYRGPVWRYRLRFTKRGAEALTGHLDLVRSLPRIFRRAGLPVRASDGFHQHAVVTFSPALPLGATSAGERMDVDFTAYVPPATLRDRLNAAAPEGLRFLEVQLLPFGAPPLGRALRAARYAVALRPGPAHPQMADDAAREACRAAVEGALFAFLRAASWPAEVERKGKARAVDLRAQVDQLGLDADGRVRLALRHAQELAARPGEVLAAALGALGWFAPVEAVDIERVGLDAEGDPTEGDPAEGAVGADAGVAAAAEQMAHIAPSAPPTFFAG